MKLAENDDDDDVDDDDDDADDACAIAHPMAQMMSLPIIAMSLEFKFASKSSRS